MEKYKNKYRIPSTRLKGYDYGSHGLYFITICTKNKINYFGEIVESDSYPILNRNESDSYPTLRQTTIGKIAHEFWQQIPQHFPFVELDEFVIMPNHVHGILFFNKPNKDDWTPNQFGPQSQNLASVVRAYKSSVKRHANQNNINFEWQSSYYDRIIRDYNEFTNVQQYIINNPDKWKADENYTSN